MSISLSQVRDQVQAYQDDLTTRQRYALAGGVLVVLALVPFVTNRFFIMNMFIFIFLYVIMGQSWNIIGGYTGQISLGHAVMFAAGAYTTTILYVYYGITPLAGLWIAGLMAAAVGLGLGAATFALRHHYFAMATLAAALIAKVVFFRWDYVGGATGIEYPLDQIGTLYSFTFSQKAPYYYIIGAFALAVTLFVYWLDHSKLGTYLKAINMDQELAENAGLSAFWYKMYAMGLSSFVVGLAGGLYAQYVLYIGPMSTLRVLRNIEIILVAIIGGVGTVLGPVVGAFIFIPVREYTRTIFGGSATGLGWVIFGVVLLLISIYRPGGLLNEYTGRWRK